MSKEMTFIVVIDILKNLNLSILTTKDIIRVALNFPNNLLIQTMKNEFGDNVVSTNEYSECSIS